MISSGDLPLVCICIPTFNAERTIGESLDSIIKQRYQNLDIHIVDNASSDATLEVVARFRDSRISIHRNDINVGGERNFNRCAQLARGKYTAIFHADDIYEVDMVGAQVAFLEANSAVGAVFTEAKLINELGAFIGEVKFPQGFGSTNYLYDFWEILKGVLKHSNFLICPSAMVRSDIYQSEHIRWRGELFSSSADLDVWLRIAQRCPIGLIPLSLMRYRLSNGQFSASVRAQTERADFFLVIDYYLDQDIIRSKLEEKDFKNYAALERRDNIKRAVNFFLAGKTVMASVVLDVSFWDDVKMAFESKKGFIVLIASAYLRILLLLKLNKFGQITLIFMKRVVGAR